MRKTIAVLLSAMTIILSFNPISSKADNQFEGPVSYTEYYPDGSYSVITITKRSTTAKATVVEGSKSYNHVVFGSTVWTYTVNGTFSYNGSSSSCTSVSDSYTISNSNWHLNSRYHWKSGNTAYGSVTMDKKILGITTDSVTHDLTLSCSANGTLS